MRRPVRLPLSRAVARAGRQGSHLSSGVVRAVRRRAPRSRARVPVRCHQLRTARSTEPARPGVPGGPETWRRLPRRPSGRRRAGSCVSVPWAPMTGRRRHRRPGRRRNRHRSGVPLPSPTVSSSRSRPLSGHSPSRSSSGNLLGSDGHASSPPRSLPPRSPSRSHVPRSPRWVRRPRTSPRSNVRLRFVRRLHVPRLSARVSPGSRWSATRRADHSPSPSLSPRFSRSLRRRSTSRGPARRPGSSNLRRRCGRSGQPRGRTRPPERCRTAARPVSRVPTFRILRSAAWCFLRPSRTRGNRISRPRSPRSRRGPPRVPPLPAGNVRSSLPPPPSLHSPRGRVPSRRRARHPR